MGFYRGALQCEYAEQGSAGIKDAESIDLKDALRCHSDLQESWSMAI